MYKLLIQYTFHQFCLVKVSSSQYAFKKRIRQSNFMILQQSRISRFSLFAVETKFATVSPKIEVLLPVFFLFKGTHRKNKEN